MSIEEQISKGEYSMGNATLEDFKDMMNALQFHSSSQPREFVFITGQYGMYEFEFAAGGVGSPMRYIHSGHHNHYKPIYITLLPKGYGYNRNEIMGKHSPYKCKVRMWNEFSKIELYYGTKLIMTANNFDDINKYMKTITSL